MSLERIADKTATVTRSTAVSGRRDQSEATTVFENVSCAAPTAADAGYAGQLQQSGLVGNILNVFQILVLGNYDIRQGDRAEVDGKTYTVRAVSHWDRFRNPITALTVELLR